MFQKMENLKEKIEKNARLRKYLNLINKIVKVEYKSIAAQHLVEYDELINIGIQTVDILCNHYNDYNDEEYNESYVATAIKWAIRNELRRRYRWHGVKFHRTAEADKSEIREAIYKTILSSDEMHESDKPFEIKDASRNPEEICEFNQISAAIKDAVALLPRRERELIEARFFQEKKLMQLSEEFSISPSRISRIIKSGLDKIKDKLIEQEMT